MLKNIIQRKFVNADLILDALRNLEHDPGSLSRQQALSEQLSAARADADVDVRTVVRELALYSAPHLSVGGPAQVLVTALTGAVCALLERHAALAGKLTEIILTAPDIDADVFRRDIAPKLAGTRNPLTLYASSEDMALVASKKVHGSPRAGDSGAALMLLDRIETIDATGVDTSLLKHSYFAERRSALSDMFYLIHNDARPDQRFLSRVDVGARAYWTFKK